MNAAPSKHSADETGLMRRLAFFPFRSSFCFGRNIAMCPAYDLKTTMGGNAGSELKITGSYRYFEFACWPSLPLPTGFCSICLAIAKEVRDLVSQRLYVGRSGGNNETEFVSPYGKSYAKAFTRTRFVLPAGARKLRLRSSVLGCQLVINSLKVR